MSGAAGFRVSSAGGEKIGLGSPRPIKLHASPGSYSPRGSAIVQRPACTRGLRVADAPAWGGLVGHFRDAGKASTPSAAPESDTDTVACEC